MPMVPNSLRRAPIVRALILLSTIALAAAPAPAQEADLAARLTRALERLDVARQEAHVPGLAVAIVSGDERILAEGLGMADLASGREVTAETIFAIGSSTKAFTATLVGMLVDEGKMDWDDPVTKYLPDFVLQLDAEDEDAELSIRDLLCHRSGFTRMGLLWASGKASREKVLQTARAAQAWAPFRSAFHYNNVMFLAAGEASARAAGTGWDELVTTRLLEPLGMESTTTSIRAAQKDARLAQGYLWNEETEEFKALPMRSLDNIAPAGAINSNVIEVAQWIRLQLGRGEFEGRRLVSEAALEETWSPQIDVGGSVDYGLGWMLREWRGRKLVEHGGNIDGFACQVALLPEEDLGMVVLLNVTASPLQSQAIEIVFDSLLGEDQAEVAKGETPALDVEEYTGTYVATFAGFDGEEFEVLEKDGGLALDIPSQMVFTLKAPDADGKWAFAFPEGIAVRFVRDEEGRVVALEIHQGGAVFEVPRKGASIEPEMSPAELRRYLGTFRWEEEELDVEVCELNGRLAVKWPGQGIFDFHPPDEEGRWVMRAIGEVEISFDEDEDGHVTAMRHYQNGNETALRRTGAAPGADLPTLEAVMEVREERGWLPAARELRAARLRGTVRMIHSGVEGKVESSFEGRERHREHTDFGEFGYTTVVVSEKGGRLDSDLQPPDELEGKLLEQARRNSPAALVGDWRWAFDSTELVGEVTRDGRKLWKVRAASEGLPDSHVYLDAETADVRFVELNTVVPGLGTFPVEVSYEDYREVGGLRVPFRVFTENPHTGTTVIQFASLETDPDLPEDLFSLDPAQ